MTPTQGDSYAELAHTPFWQAKAQEGFDLIVVGAGFTGLRVATFVKEQNPDWNICVIDALAQGATASTRNAGFACFGSPGELLADIDSFGLHSSAELLSRRFAGIKALKQDMRNEGLAVTEDGGYEVFTGSEERDLGKIIDRWGELENLFDMAGIPKDTWEPKNDLNLSRGLLDSGFYSKHEFGIDPVQVHNGLTRRVLKAGIDVYRSVLVQEIQRTGDMIILRSPGGDWTAKRVALCTNAGREEGLYNEDLLPGRGQVIVTSSIEDMRFKGNYHNQKGYYYFRNVGDRLLLGGGRHLFQNIENTRELNTTEQLMWHLRDFAESKLVPDQDFEIESSWSGIMAFRSDGNKMPMIDKVDKGVFRCVGFGGMGVALSRWASERLSVLILNDPL